MQTKKLAHLLAFAALFGLFAVLETGCSCDENEFNGEDACKKLVTAANDVLRSCSAPTVGESTVCGHATTDCRAFAGCTPTADVDGCVTAIKALSCDNVTARAYAQATECIDVLSNIDNACEPRSSSNSGGSDFD